MDKYSKAIKLSFNIDDKDMEEFQRLVDQVKNNEEFNLENLKKILKEANFKTETEVKNKSIGQEVFQEGSFWQKVGKDIGNNMAQDFTATTGFDMTSLEGFAVSALMKLKGILDDAWEELKTIVTDSWDELDNILNYSRLTSSNVRNQALTYGFNAAQNYAFSKTKEIMGFQREEDLWYMTPSQRAKFQEKFNEYSDRYSKLYDSGFFDKLEEYNWQMSEWKEDIQFLFTQFFVDNSSTIKKILEGVMTITEWVVKRTEGLFKAGEWLFGKSEGTRKAEISDYLASTVTNSSNVTKTVTLNPTYNGIDYTNSAKINQGYVMIKEQLIAALED